MWKGLIKNREHKTWTYLLSFEGIQGSLVWQWAVLVSSGQVWSLRCFCRYEEVVKILPQDRFKSDSIRLWNLFGIHCLLHAVTF